MLEGLNPYDELALFSAARLKQSHPDSRIVLMSADLHGSLNLIRKSLSITGDSGIWIQGMENMDDPSPWAEARMLQHCLADLDFDLIFLGYKKPDTEEQELGIFLAGLLDMPCVTAVEGGVTILRDSGKVTCQRILEQGDREKVLCSFPCVLTIKQLDGFSPFPLLGNIVRSHRKEIRTVCIDEKKPYEITPEPQTKSVLLRHEVPRPRTKKSTKMAKNLSLVQKMDFILSGGVSKGQAGNKEKIRTGHPRHLAEEIFDYLKDNDHLG